LRARSEGEACNLQASNLYRENFRKMLHSLVNSTAAERTFVGNDDRLTRQNLPSSLSIRLAGRGKQF
jgi:hypothetical protein